MYKRYQPDNQCQNATPKMPSAPKVPGNQKKPGGQAKQSAMPEKNKPMGFNERKKRTLFESLIPPCIYNEDSKKVLGFLSAEDLLLIALILIFLDNEEKDPIIIYALLYILILEYIDLPDILGF